MNNQQNSELDPEITGVDSNEVTFIKIYDSCTSSTPEFNPDLTHQVFPDEVIKGHTNPRIDIYYNGSTLDCYYAFSSDAQEKDCTDVDKHIANLLSPPGQQQPLLTTSLSHFESTFTSETSPLFTHTETIGDYYHEGVTYCINRCNLSSSPAIWPLHRRIESLMFLFIDEFGRIDLEEPGWTSFYVLKKISSSNYSLVGSMTAYSFFAYPDSTRLRLSQVFILPPFRGIGLAKKLVSSLYMTAVEVGAKDVLPESPGDSIVSVLDLFHCQLFRDFGVKLSDFENETYINKEKLLDICRKTALNYDLALRACEFFRFVSLQQKGLLEEDCVEFVKFRRDVKKRYYSNNVSSLLAMEVGEQKEKLDEMFTADLETYKNLLPGLERIMVD
ncbi:hypothetical protein P9112_003211 [Eukaryota sp. TZLM1-RC]